MMESALLNISAVEPNSTKASLDAFFRPRTIAVIGGLDEASGAGRLVYENLLANPSGIESFAVSASASAGWDTYASIRDVPRVVDLAVIASAPDSVVSILRDCADANVKSAVILTGGFYEMGVEGLELQRAIGDESRRSGLRVLGPNSMGVMNPHAGLNATISRVTPRVGNVAFLSQSGALCSAVLDWSVHECVGWSALTSVGSMVDVDWGDLIQYLGDDSNTKSIIVYMETFGDVRSFLSAAREVALSKPIIVIKAGRTTEAAEAISIHSGSFTSSDDVFDAAFDRCGVLRVNNISDIFYMVEVLSRQTRPRGPRLSILTNAAGPGILAADSLVAAGGALARPTAETIEGLRRCLSGHWHYGNPVSLAGDAGPECYARAVDVLMKDANTDGLLVIFAPHGTADGTAVAQLLAPYAKGGHKPMLASWMGAKLVAPGIEVLNRAGIPTFPYPDTAARAFEYLWRYSTRLQSLYETPALDHTAEATEGKTAAQAIIDRAREAGRFALNEAESKRLLAAYSIPTVETIVATTEDHAVKAASTIGYPVVLKVYSDAVTSKFQAGGVKLNLIDPDAVRYAYREICRTIKARFGDDAFKGVTVQRMIQLNDGYELVLSSRLDPQFGPYLCFGPGGQSGQIYNDRALALPPLNTTLARRMMEKTEIWRALSEKLARSPQLLRELEQILVRLSRLVAEQRWIREIEVTPLFASTRELVALDARIVLHPIDTPPEALPKLAIRPYPHEQVRRFDLADGSLLVIRPIRPEDEPAMVAFHSRLSDRTVYHRYFSLLKLEARITHDRLARICFVDYDRQMVLVADRRTPGSTTNEIVGVARLVKVGNSGVAEFAVVIADDYQAKGVGTKMVNALLEFARQEGIRKITAEILPENYTMIDFGRRIGFKLKADPRDTVVRAEMML